MGNVKKVKASYMFVVTIVFIIALVVGLSTTLIYLSQVGAPNALDVLKMVGAGIDAFLLAVALGMIIAGVIFKKSFLYLVALIFGYFGLVVLLMLCGILWWVTLIVAIGTAFIILLSAIALYRNTLALEYTDEKPDYKTYEEQRKEKLEQEKAEEEELPEIKSFKD